MPKLNLALVPEPQLVDPAQPEAQYGRDYASSNASPSKAWSAIRDDGEHSKELG
jgi:hypothetical protein